MARTVSDQTGFLKGCKLRNPTWMGMDCYIVAGAHCTIQTHLLEIARSIVMYISYIR